METKLLSTSQAAEILGVDDSRIRQLILSGRLPSMQVGRAHLIKEADLALVSDRKAGRPKKEGAAEDVQAEAKGQTSKGKRWKAEQQTLPAVVPTAKKTPAKRAPAAKTKVVATKKGGKK